MAFPVAFVLVEPQNGGNVGAAARALKNNGFAALRLVNPAPLGEEARRFARGSLDVLDGAAVFPDVAAAVADARFVVGFTARDRRDLREAAWLDEAVPRILAAEEQAPVALLFGREDRGLTNDELAPCSLLATIPAAIERPVYNVAQAVLLVAYALGRALDRPTAPRAHTDFEERALLPAADHEFVLAALREALVALGYDRHPDPGLLDRILKRAAAFFLRAGLEAPDKAMILGVVRQIQRLAGR